MLDKIHIRDIAVRCIIGINPEEREHKQEVVLNLTLECELRAGADSDRIEDTVNYRDVNKAVVKHVESSSYFLIEKLAESVAEICLGYEGVQVAHVTVDKPRALTGARSVAVEITRASG